MPRRTGALPLVVTTVDGRPIKIEGNPLHPASGGATDAFAQASILDLYDPARSKRFVEQVERTRWQRAGGETRDRARSKNISPNSDRSWPRMAARAWPSSSRKLSPTRDRLRAQLEKALPQMRWCQYEPLLTEAQSFATQISFGENARLVPRFDRADVILALDSDFLDCGEGDIASFARLRFATSGDGGEGHDEPALRGRESLHAHGCDGGSSLALSGESDSGVHPCAGREDRGRYERRRAWFDHRHA